MKNEWKTIYAVADYERDAIYIIDRYYDEDGMATDDYAIGVTYGNNPAELGDLDQYWLDHYEEGYGESPITLKQCFEMIMENGGYKTMTYEEKKEQKRKETEELATMIMQEFWENFEEIEKHGDLYEWIDYFLLDVVVYAIEHNHSRVNGTARELLGSALSKKMLKMFDEED